MDQEALNYLCYFLRRILCDQPLPYLDISKDEDIEDDSYLKLMRRKKTEMDYEADEWFHDYMLIALIKLKRLQALLVQRKMIEKLCCPPSNVCNTLTNNSWSRQIYTRLSNRHIVKLYNYSTLIEQRNFPGILELSLCLIQEYFDVYIRGHQICIIESSNSD